MRSVCRVAFAAALIGLGVTLANSNVQAQRDSSPFAGLEGSWSGGGSVSLSNGSSERIRCRATYNVAPSGNGLRQRLLCASDSYNFDLSSEVVYDGSSISGTWREATKRAMGSISGTAARGDIQARVDGSGFQASLSFATRGDRQSISIRSQGTEFSGATLSLTRSR